MALVGRIFLHKNFKQYCTIVKYRNASNKSSPTSNKITKAKLLDPEYLSEMMLEPINEDELKTGLKVATKKLQELFNIKQILALEIVSQNKKISKVPVLFLRSNYEFLVTNNISHDIILKNAGVLAETELFRKFELLEKLPYNVKELLPLLNLKFNELVLLCTKESQERRIKLIADKLEASIEEVCRCIAKRPFIVLISMERLALNLEILNEYNVTKEQVFSDLWVLKYKSDVIKSRFDIAKANNVDIIKTWMTRVPLDTFQKHIRKKIDHKMLLGDNSFLQYLSERLNCSEELVKEILKKLPSIQNRDVKKLNEMIDFLINYGYKPIHIIRSPKILLHSVNTCRKRLKELEEAGVHLDGLSLLTKSHKQYMAFLDSVRNKAKTIS